MAKKKGESAERKSEAVGLRIEGDDLKRLKRAGRSLSDEIRDRLKRTFKEDELDPPTRELRDGLVNLAAKLRVDYAHHEWHALTPAHEAFVAGVVQRLAQYAPPPQEQGPAAAELLLPSGPPETIGRIREQDDRRENSYPQLQAAQERRSKQKWATAARHMRAKKGDDNG